MVQDHDSRQGDDDISQMLRGALGNTDFDYGSLVSGVHQRAGRIRRRRAIATGAAVAVLGPALVGGAALVLPDLLADEGAVIGPAASTDVVAATSEAPNDEAVESSAPTPEQPPWQTTAPPLPEGGAEPENEDYPNGWDIPDARPTGVEALDSLGAPQLFLDYPRTPPVSGLMTCDPVRPDGVEAVSGQQAMYFTDESDLSIDLTITGWKDSNSARDGLVDDDYTLCVWDGGVGEAQPWPGHEGDGDYLIFARSDSEAAAVVRQGDYLISVTVRDDAGGGSSTEVASEIASKTADNLEALDPVHGRD